MMLALGEEFRSAREARGLSLADVSERIHIRSTYLQAIEEEAWSSIGEPVYIRGFIRTYARFLGSDSERAVERFNESSPSAQPLREYASPSAETIGSRRMRPSVWLWIGSIVALALVAYVAYGYYDLRSKPGSAPAPVAAVDSSPAATPTAAASSEATFGSTPTSAPVTNEITVRLSQRSWVRVNVDGATQLEGIYPAGTTRTFHGKRAVVRAGNAGGVNVAATGYGDGPLGALGEVVERAFALTKP